MSKQTKLVKVNEARHMVITPKARVSFPNVFVAKSFQDDPEQKKFFQVDLIFDSMDDFKKAYKGKKTETPSMSQAVFNAKKDQWGPNKEKWPKFPHKIFKDGSENKNRDGEVYAGYDGKVYVTAKTGEKYPPKVLDKFGKPITEKEFYGGCFAVAQLIARPYVFGKNQGVRWVLKSLMKVEDGERFGGISEDVFDVSEMEEDSFEGGGDSDDWSDEE